MKQTSIELLIEQVKSKEWQDMFIWHKEDIFKQAKAIHKEEIVRAAARGYLVGEDNISLEDAKLYGEEYYEMTFKTK